MYQLFRATVFSCPSLTTVNTNSPTIFFPSPRVPLSVTQTYSIQCDKFTSVTHNAIPIAIVRGSADQTLHRALLQIQAPTPLALVLLCRSRREQAGCCCHKGNHAVIHHHNMSVYEVLTAGVALCGSCCCWWWCLYKQQKKKKNTIWWELTACSPSPYMPPGQLNAFGLMS